MVRWLVALVLFLAVAVFAVQNGHGVHLAYLGMTAPAVPLAYLILASLVLGAAVTVLLGSVQLLRLRSRLVETERRLAAAQPALAAHSVVEGAVGEPVVTPQTAPEASDPSPPPAGEDGPGHGG